MAMRPGNHSRRASLRPRRKALPAPTRLAKDEVLNVNLAAGSIAGAEGMPRFLGIALAVEWRSMASQLVPTHHGATRLSRPRPQCPRGHPEQGLEAIRATRMIASRFPAR